MRAKRLLLTLIVLAFLLLIIRLAFFGIKFKSNTVIPTQEISENADPTIQESLYDSSNLAYQPSSSVPAQDLSLGTLISELDAWVTEHPQASIHQVSKQALKQVSKRLQFSSQQSGGTVDAILAGGKAHCVGYTAVYCSIMNYLLQELDMASAYRCEHTRGEVFWMGVNLTTISDDPFFQDHDFAIITNLQTGESFHVDPSLHAYTGIGKLK